MKYCSECGQQLAEDHRFCTGCGQLVSRPSQQPSTPPKHGSSKGVVGAILVLVGIVAAGASFYIYRMATDVIDRGDRLWGLGWLFEEISREDASALQALGVAGMICGVVLLIIGLVYAARENK